MVGSVRSILINRGNIVAVTLRETFVKIHSAIKIPILLLYWDSLAKKTASQKNFTQRLTHPSVSLLPWVCLPLGLVIILFSIVQY